MHLHAISIKFGLAALSSRRFGRCGFDVPASSISSQFHIQPPRVWIDNRKIREFPDRRMPCASRTDLASASAKVSLRSTSHPLILCRTIRVCSRSSRALVFHESFHFFRAVFSLFLPTLLGLVTTASLDRRYSFVPRSWGPSDASRFASGHRHSRCSPTRASF